MEMDVTTAVDGGGHLLRTNTLLSCLGMCKMISFVLVWLARPKILDGPKHVFYLGTGRMAINSLVPFRPVPQGRIELRRPYYETLSLV